MNSNKDNALASPAAHYLGLEFTQITNVAKALAGSGIFEDARDANIAFAKILAGQEMGLTPFKAMQEISFIKGKPSLSANAKAAAIKSSGKYNYRVLRKDKTGCEIEFFEYGKPIGKQAYTQEDARQSGVYDRNPNYKTNPEAMYFAGALRQGQRTYCPDATNGISTYDREEIDVIEVKTSEPSAPDVLTPASVADDINWSESNLDKAIDEYEEGVEKITVPQQKKIFALFKTKEITNTDEQKSILKAIVKRDHGTELESTKDLSKAWAIDVIDTLEKATPEELKALVEPF